MRERREEDRIKGVWGDITILMCLCPQGTMLSLPFCGLAVSCSAGRACDVRLCGYHYHGHKVRRRSSTCIAPKSTSRDDANGYPDDFPGGRTLHSGTYDLPGWIACEFRSCGGGLDHAEFETRHSHNHARSGVCGIDLYAGYN